MRGARSMFTVFRRFAVGTAAVRAAKMSPRAFLVGAGGTSLAVSFFSAKEEKPKPPFPNYDIVIRETDTLYDNYLIDNAYNILRKYENSEYPELLWRLARVLCEKGKQSKNPADRKKYFLEAYAVVQRSLSCEPPEGSFGAHKWMAILLDYVGEIEGTKSRIAKSYEVRKHLERALEINGQDATTWHILGIWHFTFADMSSITRLAAKAIFGTPPSSTYQEALELFLKAEQIQPNFYSKNTYYIGEVYDRLGRHQESIQYYRQSFMAPVVTVDDRETHNLAHDKLRKAKVAAEDLVNRR
ncbi:hypothetical protein PFISCL1PPCAC_19259 [Pristionchus fissidentatus]|uniref:Regulator of microtubule dynamics protein 1 n=1 Tax=Pristionchus fissidentatus TaxID=1538716 RepID=A0AAV5WAF2_9BILA|nr:hypothetical protein PFISCL1PPCAC_19259 [Pristionchus fissidentatus]